MSDEIQYDPRIAAMYKAGGGGKTPKPKPGMISTSSEDHPSVNTGRSGGGGWQPIPGGKHGGMRRPAPGHPGQWEYKYPNAMKAKAAAGHHKKLMRETLGVDDHPKGSASDHADAVRGAQHFSHSARKHPQYQHYTGKVTGGHTSHPRDRSRGGSGIRKAEGSNPLDLVNANPAIPSTMRQGSVTYAVAAAHAPAPERSIPSLRGPAPPAYEQAEREVLDLVNDLPRVNGVLTHPNGVDRRN